MMLRGFLSLFLSLIASTGLAIGNEHQFTDIDALKQQLKAFATDYFDNVYREQAKKGDVRVTVNSLDTRLQLKQCDQAVNFAVNAPAHRSNKITVKTSCKGENRWTIYVPVTADVYDEVIVAAHSLDRGTVLTAADLSLQRININKFGPDYLINDNRLIGMELKRSLGVGETLKLSYVKPTDVITRGDSVVLESSSTGVTIQTIGTALDYGHVGERIRVRNDQSEKVVDAVVIGRGKVSTVSR